jgi:hypothetical protein
VSLLEQGYRTAAYFVYDGYEDNVPQPTQLARSVARYMGPFPGSMHDAAAEKILSTCGAEPGVAVLDPYGTGKELRELPLARAFRHMIECNIVFGVCATRSELVDLLSYYTGIDDALMVFFPSCTDLSDGFERWRQCALSSAAWLSLVLNGDGLLLGVWDGAM